MFLSYEFLVVKSNFLIYKLIRIKSLKLSKTSESKDKNNKLVKI